jgi:hypothetical protein
LPCGAQKRKNPPCEVISRFQLATSRARGRIFAKAWSFWVKRRWEIAADRLTKAGWSWGYVSAIDSSGRTIWIADAHRGDGKHFK